MKESADFSPQDEFDETNRYFIKTKYAHQKLIGCPLASLSVTEIRDQTRVKGDQVFFFGAAQTDLAYLAEENEPTHEKLYYKSSTPLIAVIKYLKHLRRMNNDDKQTTNVEPRLVDDTGFCVRSNPDFLYQIAKICW